MSCPVFPTTFSGTGMAESMARVQTSDGRWQFAFFSHVSTNLPRDMTTPGPLRRRMTESLSTICRAHSRQRAKAQRAIGLADVHGQRLSPERPDLLL